MYVLTVVRFSQLIVPFSIRQILLIEKKNWVNAVEIFFLIHQSGISVADH